MTPATPQKVASNTDEQTIARIDAQDEHFVEPLREFLVSFGCKVFVNRKSQAPIDYHIICGDSEFVKEFFSLRVEDAKKRLVIVTDGNDQNAEEIQSSAKIIFVDFLSFTPESISAVFQFFFTSGSKVLDLRKNPKKHVLIMQPDRDKKTPHVKESQEQIDKKRINTIVHSIFSPGKSVKKDKTKRKRTAMWRLGILVIFFPFFWYSISITLATASVAIGAVLLRSGNVEGASRTSAYLRFWIDQSSRTLSFIKTPFSLVKEDATYGQERYLSLMKNLGESIAGVSNIFLTGKTLAGEMMTLVGEGEQSSSPGRQVDKLRTELFSVQNHVGLAQSELHELLIRSSFPFWFPGSKQLGSRAEAALSRYRETISYIDKFLLLYPRVAGFKKKQVYLVLLQNSMELRPTGGFIGSVAVLSAEEGRIVDLQVRDVYELDGQLKGHVDPPLPVREMLGQEHWYLRDSNWEADFRDSASRAAWFYEKETGGHVDGVFAISTPFIVDLLSMTGPLTLADYNDRITSQNFYGKSLFYTQSDFFPGSTQKKDFLGSLTRALMDELITSKKVNPVRMFRTLTNSLSRRDLLVYFSDTELGNIVTQFGWSGQVFASYGCEGVSGSCFFDPLMVVEANLGVNKVNYFTSRQLSRAITIGADGGVTEKVTLRIENTSRGQLHDSGGFYRAYIRYLLTPGTQVKEVQVNGIPLISADRKLKAPPALPYTEYNPSTGVMGIAVEIPAGQTSQLSVEYKSATPLTFTREQSTYEVFVQKQPGVNDTRVGITVSFPPFWEAQYSNAFLAKEGHLEYNTTLSQDAFIRIRFLK